MKNAERSSASRLHLDRRDLLRVFPSVAISLLARGLFPSIPQASTGPAERDSHVMDEALEILAGFGPEYGSGLSNHAPMAAEALIAMGRADAVLPWIERYRGRLQGPAEGTRPISKEEWREALGDERRVGDWIAFFERELAGAPWPDVLRSWLPRLAPGLVGAATHCLIRTGHAARRVQATETPLRRRELAHGLGYWAARYQTLPGTPSDAGSAGPAEAIGHVELLPTKLRRSSGLLTPRMLELQRFAPFEDVINEVDPEQGRPDFLSELTRVFADVYLQNDRNLAIAFIHAVTGPSALRLLSPWVEPQSKGPASRYAWQAAAAIYATFASSKLDQAAQRHADENLEELVDRAVTNGNTHTIKFTEACLREYAVNPHPVYLAAARDSTEKLRPLS